MEFRVQKSDTASRARLGSLTLPHGAVDTPCFMPVGTQATVKTLTPEELAAAGAQIIVCNSYHLYLRPGQERVKLLGGLHRLMGWDRCILTDSGGFQVYSLAALSKVTDEGAEFQSHVDGSRHFFTPELVMQVQCDLGSDIAMCLDECPAYPVSRDRAADALERTALWARRCREAVRTGLQGYRVTELQGHATEPSDSPNPMTVFGIVQGATYADLRRRSAQELAELDFPGYALGGLCLGEPSELTYELAAAVKEILPPDRPAYLMGAGYPEDIIEAVKLGIDMFDCVLPTRNGRTGTAFTSAGTLAIRNARFADDPAPVDSRCSCYTCRTFSRAYLRHLFIAGEALGPRLLTLHNVWFFQDLVRGIRNSIEAGSFSDWSRTFLSRYSACKETEDPDRTATKSRRARNGER